MQLDKFTDYALRILITLTVAPQDRWSVASIAKTYGLSEHHLAKVASKLVREGYVVSERGRGGGLRLAHDATKINIGTVVRQLKSDTPVVECFGENKSCRILPACGLRSPLQQARDAFFSVLDGYTLADVTNPKSALDALLKSQ